MVINNSDIIISLGFFAIFFMITFNGFQKRKQSEKHAKETNSAVDRFSKVLLGLNTKMDIINTKSDEVLSLIKSLNPQPGCTRVYGVILQRGVETRLFVVPAENFEMISEIVKAKFGNEWLIIASAQSDVVEEVNVFPSVDSLKVEGEKQDIIKKNLTNYVMDLKYARDNFTKKVSERKTIDTVINNIEKHYGKHEKS